MRPINKGSSPIRGGEFATYTDALDPLVKRLGNYCSYCERIIENNLAVEHRSPKKRYPKEERKWRNFLIACTQCNSSKGNKDVNPKRWRDFVWPDKDDTYHMICYLPQNAYKATPSSRLNAIDKDRVQRTLNLVKLNSNTNMYGKTTYKSKLAKRREIALKCTRMKKAFLQAQKLLLEVPNHPIAISNCDNIRKDIKDAAELGGCWSIWMNYFEGIPEIKEELLTFPGTNRQYFL